MHGEIFNLKSCLRCASFCTHRLMFCESCTVKDRSGCNVTIQYLTDSYPAFRECSCLEDKSCNFLGQLGILCTGQGGNSTTRSNQSSPSCLKVTELCMKDQDICNKHFTPQKQVCPNSLNQCNLDDCHSAIRSFYLEIPPDLAQMLVFCRCHPSDELCLQAKEILHNNSCANRMDPKPTCLYLTERCLSDEVCRLVEYEVFQAKCWERVRRICHHDKDCLSEISWRGLTCSASDECKTAYVDTRGTLLQMECTCSGVRKEEQSLCEVYQHMLNRELCFSNPTYGNREGHAGGRAHCNKVTVHIRQYVDSTLRKNTNAGHIKPERLITPIHSRGLF
uniref:GDNF family receptor alpha like n=1 Tax=Callorhinchus milii TaxID=7868 RepID=A0A4W3JKM7_CALMI